MNRTQSLTLQVALLLSAFSFSNPPRAASTALSVCMAEDNPPLSYVASEQPRGLDVLVAQAVANELERPLKIIPFGSKFEADSSLTHEVNALLSSGVCELASGFPLLSTDLGPPTRPTARVPDYPGAKRPPQRPWVPLGTLVPTLAYHTVALGLVVRDSSRVAATLSDPGDARLGVSAGTVAGTILALYRNGKLRPQLVSLSQDQNALAQLEAGQFDATLSSLDRLDAWRLAHPSTLLRRTGYVHPLRINIGFVARAESTAELDAANRVIERLLADGSLERMATASGSTWIPPRDPQVGAPVGLAELMNE